MQERVRFDIRQNARAHRFGMNDMFASNEMETESRRLMDRRLANLERARREVDGFLLQRKQFAACDAWAVALAIPLVTIKDAKRILTDLVKAGRVRVELRERQRVPSADTIVRVV